VNSVAHGEQRIQDDAHGLGLVRGIVAAGYAAERRESRRKGDPHGLDTMFLTITPKGTALVSEASPTDPLVEDGRAGEED
jgi:hypothetical protein